MSSISREEAGSLSQHQAGTLKAVSQGSESYAIDHQCLIILTSTSLWRSWFGASETVVMRPAAEAVSGLNGKDVRYVAILA
jgi:hypothetical protein